MAKDYPRIDLTVDAVVFGYKAEQGIFVLLIKRKNDPFKGLWAIPGGFVNQDEPLDDAVSRELKEETGIEVNYLEQLHAFGDPKRDPRKRVVSIAYYALVKPDAYKVQASDDAEGAEWFSIKKLPKLAFDHHEILDMAISRLRYKISHEPVGFELLGHEFSFSELHKLYETLYNKKIDRRNFKKKFIRLGLLKELKQKTSGKGRPGFLYKFDKKKYFQHKKKGIVFEV
jgi:8-oxo-dGTP diphosphatase